MARRTIAIDAGNGFVRLVEVQAGRIERWADSSFPLEDGAGEPALEALGGHIRELWRSSQARSGDVIISLSGRYSFSRVITVPTASMRETIQAVTDIANSTFPSEDLSVRWEVLNADGQGQQVLLIASPTSLSRERVAAFQAAGVRPQVAELRSAALARAADRERAVIVSAEPGSADIAVVVNGMPHVLRTVTLDGDEGGEICSQIALHLQRTVGFYNEQHPRAPVTTGTPLVVAGSLAEDSDLADRLARQTGFQLAEMACPLAAPPHFPLERFAVAVGLAMRREQRMPRPADAEDEGGLKPLNINLMPAHRIRVLGLTRNRAIGAAMIAAGLLLSGVAFGYVEPELHERAALEARVSELRLEVDRRLTQQRRIGQLQEAIADFDRLTAPRGRVERAVETVDGSTIPGVTITRYNVTENNVEFSARADTVEIAEDYIERLREQGWDVPPLGAPSREITIRGPLPPPPE